MVTLAAYPAPDWSLSVILRGVSVIDLDATPDGEQHSITADAATTAEWEAGQYWYSVRATSAADGSVQQVEEGTLQIMPDLSAAGASYDGRNHVEKTLEALEAVIEGRASKDQERYRINNRELYRTPIGELLKMRAQYKAELARIRAAAKGSSLLGRPVRVRF